MSKNFGLTILQIALAFFLIVSGILGLVQSSSGELKYVVGFLDSVFKNNSVITMGIIFTIAIAELIAGVFLLIEFFTGKIRLTSVILIAFIILWICNMIMVDVAAMIGSNILKNLNDILNYLSRLSRHLMILGACITVKEKNRI